VPDLGLGNCKRDAATVRMRRATGCDWAASASSYFSPSKAFIQCDARICCRDPRALIMDGMPRFKKYWKGTRMSVLQSASLTRRIQGVHCPGVAVFSGTPRTVAIIAVIASFTDMGTHLQYSSWTTVGPSQHPSLGPVIRINLTTCAAVTSAKRLSARSVETSMMSCCRAACG
jgi:hypothetical protein